MSIPGARAALVLAALLALPGAAARAAGQASWTANVSASVRVAPPPVLLTSTRDLEFGFVAPGMVVDVPAQPPYVAGTWAAGVRFDNLRKTVVYGIRFTLPASLANGSTQLPVSWAGQQYGWMCVWNTSNSTPASCDVQQTTFDPSAHTGAGSPLVVDLPNNTPGNNVFAADVYVGGRLSVPNQTLPPGTYSAPLTVTISVIN